MKQRCQLSEVRCIGRLLLLPALFLGIGDSAIAVFTPYTFTTLAGTPPPLPGSSVDGTGPQAQFVWPISVAADASGNVYVADRNDSTIRKVTPAGIVTTLAGSAVLGTAVAGSTDGPESVALFNFPEGVAVDGSGNVYVADTHNDTIRKISSAGMVTTFAGTAGVEGSADGTGPAAQFQQPGAVAVDANGNVYVADTGNCTIRKITPAGVVTTLAGTARVEGSADGMGPAAQFAAPEGLAVDANGNVYVADTFNETIRKVTPAGMVTTVAGTAGFIGSADGTGSSALFDTPYGVAVDASGNLYVGDTENDTIRKITPGGIVTTFAGSVGNVDAVGVYARAADGIGAAAGFDYPSGLAVDGNGNIYVADKLNNEIRKISPAAVVTTLAGALSQSAGWVDGPGNVARFNGPGGLTVDGTDNVYVADTYNNAIREISPNGVVTTLAGSPNNPVFGQANGVGLSAQFEYPGSVTLDGSGNLYVTDIGIRKITPAGVVTTFAASLPDAGNFGTTAPGGLALDSAGNFYFVDNDTIQKITPAGVVTTLAGTLGVRGSANGTGSVALFAEPSDLAVDGSGNVYVADFVNNMIRKISPDGVVTTLAGSPGTSGVGNSDGTGAAAQFRLPSGVAVDTAGNVYVADSGNDEIRKITPAGVVTTLAGAGPPYAQNTFSYADGTGAAAQFNNPTGIAIDGHGNIYVVDTGNNVIRVGHPDPGPVVDNGTANAVLGQAVTFAVPATDAAGDPLTYSLTGATNGTATLVGYQVTFTPSAAGTGTVTFTANDGYITSGTSTVTITTILPQPVITLQANSQTIASGHSVAFNVSATGSPAPTYQWTFNGSTTIPGAANTTDSILLVGAASPGTYVCTATNSSGAATSSATLTVTTTATPGYLTNLSGRGQVGSGAGNALFGRFGIAGTGSKQLLIRGIGPGLNTFFGITGELTDPLLTLFNSGPAEINQNGVWGGTTTLVNAEATLGAFPVPANSLDSMLYLPLAVGSYSAEVTSAAGYVTYNAEPSGAGPSDIVLVELYDADAAPPSARLNNLSVRAPVGTGANIIIGGFSIGGNTAETLLIRAMGPSLASPPFNLTGILAQPVLTLYSGQTPIYSNTIWGGDQVIAAAETQVGAYDTQTNSQDSMLLVTLPPGSYSAQVSGLNGTAGIATVEIYELP